MNAGVRLTLPAIRPSTLIRRAPLAAHPIEPPVVVSIALLSLANDAGELFDPVELRQRLSLLDEVSIVPLAPAQQPSQHVPLA
jgi:hypothetical protein